MHSPAPLSASTTNWAVLALRETLNDNDRLILDKRRLERLNQDLQQQIDKLQQLLTETIKAAKQAAMGGSSEPPSRNALGAAQRAARRRASQAPPGAYVAIGHGVIFDAEGWRLIGANGATAHLTPNEGMIMRTLAGQVGVAVRYAAILDAVWQGEMPSNGEQHVLRVNIARLRGKLKAVGSEGLLETIPGVGIRLEVQP
jgi:DNA-binding response OmpR family regulator